MAYIATESEDNNRFDQFVFIMITKRVLNMDLLSLHLSYRFYFFLYLFFLLRAFDRNRNVYDLKEPFEFGEIRKENEM